MTLEVAEVLLVHDMLRREEIPGVAVSPLESGTDTSTIRRLAGLVGSDLTDAHELFRHVLQELGRNPPKADEAAKTIATYLASLALRDGADLRAVAADGAKLAPEFDYHASLMPFVWADDAYDLRAFWNAEDVDRELMDHSRRLLGKDRPGSERN